jgi:hypothetical protein
MSQAYCRDYWLGEEASVVSLPLTPKRIALLRAELRASDRRIVDGSSGAPG